MASNINEYVFISFGCDTSRPDLEQPWDDWFALRADPSVDHGKPLGPGREVTRSAGTDVTADASAARRPIVRAASLDDAERLRERCPVVDSCRTDETSAI